MNTKHDYGLGWSVGAGAEEQYGSHLVHVLSNICTEVSGDSKKNVVYSKYREKTSSDIVKKLDWHYEMPQTTDLFIIEKAWCKDSNVPTMLKFPAKKVVAYSVKMCEHENFIEVFSIMRCENLVRAI